jgi:predicted GNAT family acetyltransferase
MCILLLPVGWRRSTTSWRFAITTPPDDAPIVDATDESRFVIQEGGREAELVYRIAGNRLELIHTGVPEEWAGRGTGGRLVRAALARARAEHLVVVAWCPFANRWLRDHPDETAGLVVDWEDPRPTP